MAKWTFALAVLAASCGCMSSPPGPARAGSNSTRHVAVSGTAERILQGAKLQLDHPARYTGDYFTIAYPMGDVPKDRGACVDVVIRALRAAGYDLQELIHRDISRHMASYPKHGARPDSNIDHRRVPNQRYYFSRHGLVLSTRTDGSHAKDWHPGDIVTWKLDSGRDHTGVISDVLDAEGLPFVIHNLAQTAEEDVLTRWKITGHYRFPAPARRPG